MRKASSAVRAAFPAERAAAARNAVPHSRGDEGSRPPAAPSGREQLGISSRRRKTVSVLWRCDGTEARDKTWAEVPVGAVPGRFPEGSKQAARRERAMHRKASFLPRAARGGGGDYKSRLPGEEPARGCRSPSLAVGAQRSPATALSPAGSARRGRPATFPVAGQGSAPRAAEESGARELQKETLQGEPSRGLRREALRGSRRRECGTARGCGEEPDSGFLQGNRARQRTGGSEGAAGQRSLAGELLAPCGAAGRSERPGAATVRGLLAGGCGGRCGVPPRGRAAPAPRVGEGRAGGRAPPQAPGRGRGGGGSMGGGGDGSVRGPPAAADAAAGRPRGG